jgi:hypothetical protein
VYAHQRELGALRLGEAPGAPTVDARVIAEAIAAFDRRDERRESSDNCWARRREMRLIEFDKLEQGVRREIACREQEKMRERPAVVR